MIVMIVEPHLADRSDPRVAQVLQQLLFKRVIVELRIVRMATDPDSHLWLGELETRKLVGIVDALRLFEP